MTDADIVRFPAEGKPGSKLVFNGVTIHDRDEMLSLTDMWRAQGGDLARKPVEWLDSADGKRFCETASELLNPLKNIKVGNPHFEENQLVITKRGGKAPGTWAHWQIALAYAKYLSPEFHMQCNVVIRSYMEGRPARSPIQQALASREPGLTDVAKNEIGGIVKRCVGVVLRDELAETFKEIANIRQQVAAVTEIVNPSVPGVYTPGKRLVMILEEAGFTKRPRGLVQFLGRRLAAAGIMPTGKDNMKVHLYSQDKVNEWLGKSGHVTLSRYIAEKRGQNSLPGMTLGRSKRTSRDGLAMAVVGTEIVTLDMVDTDLRRGDHILVALTNGQIEINEFGGEAGASIPDSQQLGPRMIYSAWRVLTGSHRGEPRYVPHRYGGLLIGKVIDRKPMH